MSDKEDNTKSVTVLSVSAARFDLANILNSVSYGGQTVVLTRHGKPVAKIEPVIGNFSLTEKVNSNG